MKIFRAIEAAKIAGIPLPAGLEESGGDLTFGRADAPLFHSFYVGIWGLDQLYSTLLLLLAFYAVGACDYPEAPAVGNLASYLLKSLE